jgi:Chalcone isomerase-like
MSRSTRSSRLSLALLFLTAFAASDELASGIPPAVAAQIPDVKIRGSGEMTFLGLSIYDVRLFRDVSARGDVTTDESFALQLVYKRKLYGALIAARSVEEMTKLGYGSADELARWGERLKQILPDVDAGDSLTGVNLPHRGVFFYQNGKPIGSIDDPGFARAFFAIWLDPRTSEPVLRRQLLGQAS